MAIAVDLPSGASRDAEVGLVWEEKITNGSGDLKVTQQNSIRVDALATTTVALDGVLAMTIPSGKDVILNVGTGNSTDKSKVTVTITGTAHVQVARDSERGRYS